MDLDARSPLADVVLAAPRRARLLEALRLDYCCHGTRTLAEACAERGLDGATVAAVLSALDAADEHPHADEHDVAEASVEELCEHIVVVHHGPLRTSLNRIDRLLDKVVRVHRDADPDLDLLRGVFDGLRDELDEHMAVEEAKVFPACRELDRGVRAHLGEDEIAALEDDHADVGEALVALRELTAGYDPGRALCATHRALLDALRSLASELHQHIHEENNILFPRTRALVEDLGAAGGSSLA